MLGLDPATHAPVSAHLLAAPPLRLAAAPDGRDLYTLGPSGTEVRHLDLASGTERLLAALPGAAVDLAATGDRLSAPHTHGAEVWALERRSGRLDATVAVGRRPTAIVSGPAPPRA